MSNIEQNKQVIQRFVKAIWGDRNLAALPDFWSENCINHAMPGDRSSSGILSSADRHQKS
jgi:hypothetical protein